MIQTNPILHIFAPKKSSNVPDPNRGLVCFFHPPPDPQVGPNPTPGRQRNLGKLVLQLGLPKQRKVSDPCEVGLKRLSAEKRKKKTSQTWAALTF